MKKMIYLFTGILLMHLLAMPSGLLSADYTLADLYRIALQRAEKIKVSEESVNIAKLDISRARGALVPNLSAYVSFTQYAGTHRGDTANILQPNQAGTWGLQLAQSYSLSGRDFTVLDIANKTWERSRYDLASFQQDYLLNISAAFYDLLKAKQALEIATANLDRLAKYREAANTRLRVG
ncbi:MAG: TolC family protein, partial [Syntrophales bacterium LBB04]|nr:TolC family protein [Syntrophales bacterium LBB04]